LIVCDGFVKGDFDWFDLGGFGWVKFQLLRGVLFFFTLKMFKFILFVVNKFGRGPMEIFVEDERKKCEGEIESGC
jgi:hypothetical protein